MAWTIPRTYIANELMTAAILNVHVRDNFNALLQTTSTITTTGTQTALALPAGGRGDLVLFANNATLLTIQGIAAGSDGQRLTIHSKGAGQVGFAHQHASAADANKLINFATSADSVLAAGSGVAEFTYDSTTGRWRMAAFDQGAWITPTFAAGDWTGSGSMTWTVAAGDVATDAYYLQGRRLHVMLYVATTTVGGTPSTSLRRTVPGGFTVAKNFTNAMRTQDNGTGRMGLITATAASTLLTVFVDATGAGNWLASTDNTGMQGECLFEVQ